MPHQDSYKAPVSFSDVAACFSEEEWKFLHQWQKDLYKNIMYEIHQAVSTLGPMIANSVFSLKPKGYEKVYDLDIEETKLSCDSNPFRGDSTSDSNAAFRKSTTAKQDLKHSPDTDERRSSDSPNTVPIDSFSLKKEGDVETLDYSNPQPTKCPTKTCPEVTRPSVPVDAAGGKESYDIKSQDYVGGDCVSSSPEPEVPMPYIPMGINEEGETYPIEIQDYGKRVGISSYVGDKARTHTFEESVTYDDTSLPCKDSSENVNVILTSEKASDSGSDKWPASNWSLRGVKVSKFEGDLGNNTHSGSYQGIGKGTIYVGHNKSKGDLLNTDTFTGEDNSEKSFGNDISPKCNFQCKDCEKRFRSKGHLISHERTHSGEKPYHCSVCDKSFSQKHRLIGHQRTHSGEKPFQCDKCNRTFSWRDSLHRHYRTHTGERPYQCTTCMKCFGQKETLVKHMEIHTRHKQNLDL